MTPRLLSSSLLDKRLYSEPMPQSSLRWLVLLLLVPLSSSASSTQLKPYCADGQMGCFVNGKCINDGLADEIMKVTLDKLCDVNMEIRPYSKNKALIRLRARKGPIKVVYSDKRDEPIFGCALIDGEVVPTVADSQKQFFGAKLETEGIECGFFFEQKKETPGNDDPVLLFDPTKVVDIVHDTPEKVIPGTQKKQIDFALPPFIKCDMDWLDASLFTEDKEWVYVDANRRFNDVVCEKDQELVYLEDAESDLQLAGGVVCKQDAADGNKWKYFIYKKPKKSGTPDLMVNSATAIGCRSRVCQQCKPLDCATPGTCPTFKPVPNGCPKLECAMDRIQINSEPATIGQPQCVMTVGEGEDAPKTYGWALNGKAITTALCAQTVSCYGLRKLKLDDQDVGAGDTEIACPDTTSKIKIEAPGVSPAQTDKIVCGTNSGSWATALGKPIPEKATLTCLAVAATTIMPSAASVDALTYVAAGIGALIILAVIGIVIFCLVCKPKMQKRKNAKKIKTIVSARTDNDIGTKTAIPLGFVPPPSQTNSDPLKPPKPEPELVEKTMIAHTPESKPKSMMMKTAILPTMTEAEQEEQLKQDQKFADNVTWGAEHPVTDLKTLQKKSQSEGSDPRPVRIGKDGEIIPMDRSGDQKSKQSETKKEEKKEKPVDNGPKPKVFALDPKEELIRRGATVKAAEYPTLADINSDWEDFDEAKAKAAGNMEAGKKQKRGKTTDKNKTVPTAVTPDVPASVERTQNTRTRNSVDKGEVDMDNLVTQLDTTVEQKAADGKAKGK